MCATLETMTLKRRIAANRLRRYERRPTIFHLVRAMPMHLAKGAISFATMIRCPGALYPAQKKSCPLIHVVPRLTAGCLKGISTIFAPTKTFKFLADVIGTHLRR